MLIPEYLDSSWNDYELACVSLRRRFKWGTPIFDFKVVLVDLLDDLPPVELTGSYVLHGELNIYTTPRVSGLFPVEQELKEIFQTLVEKSLYVFA